MMTNLIRVMLVEDNPEYSDVIKLALDCETDITLAERFGTSEIALKRLKDPLLEVPPDVILLDLRLPGMDGLDALPLFVSAAPQTKIIVLTQSDQEQDVLRAITLGASGYLLKTATVEKLTDSIRTVVNGGAPLDSSVAKYILQTLQTTSMDEEEHVLSLREYEILKLLADGMVKKEIAKRLDISYTTVDTHVGRIYAKLNVHNAAAAVHEAHRRQIFLDAPQVDE